MSDFIFAAQQGRKIPKEDKNFAVNNRAKAMIAEKGKDSVVNATIGVLLDEEGKLVVLSSVDEVFKTLSGAEFAEYAPIGGIPGFKDAVLKDTFGSYSPKSHTRVVATPGGTGALHSAIANYSLPGDKVLLTDWYWGPYGTIAGEIGRSLHTFKLVDEQGKFNTADFEKQVMGLLEVQDRLVIILNTPAHNPTGYSLTLDEWESVASVLDQIPEDKRVTLVVDVAYLDFAGEPEKYREFMPVLDSMGENVLPVIAYSFSKSFTLYGMRCGAMICMADNEEVAEEFRSVCEYSARAAWSNCNRAPQVMLSKIYSDPALLARVQEERAGFRDMLLRRGRAFEAAAKEVGLEIVPFDAGFFASVPCSQPDAAAAELEKEGIFTIPLSMGIRVSIASITEETCKRLPARIKAAIEATEK